MSNSRLHSRQSSDVNTSEGIKTKMVLDIHVKLLHLKTDKPLDIRLIWVRNKSQAKTKWKVLGESGIVHFDEKF